MTDPECDAETRPIHGWLVYHVKDASGRIVEEGSRRVQVLRTPIGEHLQREIVRWESAITIMRDQSLTYHWLPDD